MHRHCLTGRPAPCRTSHTGHRCSRSGAGSLEAGAELGKLWAKNRSSKDPAAMPTGVAEALNGHTSAMVQLVTSDAACVEATLENVMKADGAQFKVKAR